MSPFVTFKDEDKSGVMQYYILQRDFPHYIAIISDRPINGSLTQVPITSHNLWVTFNGVLRGNYIPAYRDVEQQIEGVMHSMATWFYENRILKEPKRYKKWALQ